MEEIHSLREEFDETGPKHQKPTDHTRHNETIVCCHIAYFFWKKSSAKMLWLHETRVEGFDLVVASQIPRDLNFMKLNYECGYWLTN